MYGYSNIKQDLRASEYPSILESFIEIINEYAMINDPSTNPGVVILKQQPTSDLYHQAVQQEVTLDHIYPILTTLHAQYKGYKNARGLIGALSSIAWNNTSDKTFELISYRKQQKWGTKRDISSESVMLLDKTFPTTFDNFDYINNHNRLVPNSPCPVLFGIRGESPQDLITSLPMIISETIDSWLLFETNQATDDHLQEKQISEIRPFESVIIKGIVKQNPVTIPGGHVIFSIKDVTGEIDCAVYEPTKELRYVVRRLYQGDKVKVYGGIRDHPLTINVEKLQIIRLVKVMEKKENPICPVCKKHMKSKGTNQGFKCKRCGKHTESAPLKEKQRLLTIGFFEAPICARRHLSKPLKRMK